MTERFSSERARRRAIRPQPFDDRRRDGKAQLWLQVLQLMRLLESSDAEAAADALAELNGVTQWFDWQSLAPSEMSASQRARLVQLLRLMAGTNSVGEACNAYRRALRMLHQPNAPGSGRPRDMWIRKTLVNLHWVYTLVLGLAASVVGFAFAVVCIFVGWQIARDGSPDYFAIGGGVFLIVIGVMFFLSTLPGITPGLRGGRSGDARTARRRDVRRSGIYRRR